MGSFSSSCGISSVPIQEGDDVGFVLMMRNEARVLSWDAVPNQYVYSTDCFSPFMGPIHGSYDDYGSLENIVRNENTALLEEIFNISIETIIECATSNRGVYGGMGGGIFEAYHGKEDKFDAFGSTPESNLLLMGFEKICDNKFRFGDFKVLFTEKAIDGRFTQFTFYFINEKEDKDLAKFETIQDFSSVFEAFSRVTGVYPGFKEEDYSRIKMLDKMTGMFILSDVFSEMHDSMMADPYTVENTKRVEKDFGDLIDIFNMPLENESENIRDILAKCNHFHRLIEATSSFPVGLLPLLKDRNVSGFRSMFDLSLVMYATNRLFQPSFSGAQDGDVGTATMLNKVVAKILNGKQEAIEALRKEFEDE